MRHRHTSAFRPAILLGAVGLALSAGAVQAQTRNWVSPVTGNWSDAFSWSGSNVPDSTGENAFIGQPGGYTIFVNNSYSIGGLAIPGTAPGAQVAIMNGRNLDVLAIDNSGTITISDAGGAGATNLRALGAVSIVGSGAIVLNANSNLETATLLWYNNTGSQSFTNGPEHTVQGSGRIHALFTNEGLVSADRAGQTLELLSTSKTNNGVMQSAGGILRFSGVTVTQAGAAQIAANGGRVDFAGTAVNGGSVLINSGQGRVITESTFGGITLQGTVDVLNGVNLNASGSLTNYGEIVISDGVNAGGTNLRATGDVPLNGTGSILLLASPANLDTATLLWYNNSGSQNFTNTQDHTIHGTGNIHVRLNNQGLVAADLPGRTLQLTSTTKINSGGMLADAGGTLAINGVLVDQGLGGSLAAGAGLVHLINSTINAGSIYTPAPAGLTRVTGTSTLVDLGFTGAMSIDNGSTLRIAGAGLVNNGAIAVSDNTGAGGTNFRAAGAEILSGNGQVILNASANLDTATLLWDNNSGSQGFTNAATHTIRGTGNVYCWLVNAGQVLADRPAATLQLLSQNKTNSGLMKALNGGTLLISGITVTQETNGQIVADGGHLRVLNSAITNGPIAITPTGSAVFAGTSTISGVSFSGLASVPDGSSLRVGGSGLTNTGTITVSDGASAGGTRIGAMGAMTLNGTGAIELNANPGNLETAALYWFNNTGSQSFTNGPLHTIKGCGNVHVLITNNGLVTADKPGRTLQLLSTTKTNNSIFRAENDATLAVNGVAVNQAPTARIEANDANLSFINCEIDGGAIAPDVASSSTVAGSAGFSGVTHTGLTQVSPGSHLSIGGTGIVNNGVIKVSVDTTAAGTALHSRGAMTFAGNGSVELDANPASLDTAYLYWNNNSGSNIFINSSTHTIRGSGNIHVVTQNQGLLTADKPGRILQLVSTSKTNSGLMNTNSGLLNINGVTVTQSGPGRIDAANGNVNVINSTIIGGTLDSAGGSSVVCSGSNRFSGVTSEAQTSLTDGAEVFITPPFENNGVVRVGNGAGGGGTRLRADAAVTFSGTGSVILAANPANLDTGYLYWNNNSGSNTFTNGPSHTVGGTGRIYTHFTNAGTIAPGAGPTSTGVIDLRATSSFLPSSVARFKISGTGAGQFDRITGTSSLALNGTLRAGFFGGFVPNVGESFTVISGPTIVGEFSRIEMPKGWWVEYGSNFVRVHFTGCLADWNYSGGVDGDDVIAFFELWDNGLQEADINLDGGVDGDDVIDFFARWDSGC